VSFTLRGHTTDAVARHLVSRGVYASNGDFYAKTVAERLDRGDDGFVRAGAACYTSAEEVDRLIDGVKDMARAR
jgi:selenocysteine lyase/cysteine desulfurase